MGTIKLYILHGWTYSANGVDPLEKWQPFIKLLEESGLKCELPKIPGITKGINEFWTLDKYVEWLKKLINKENKVILLGHSNGGRISIAFAQKYPQKVEKLILVDSACIYHNELSIRLKRFIFRNIAKVGKKISSSENLRKLIYKIAREGDYSNSTPNQRKTMINLINTDLTDVLNKIKTPTLIIWGKQDKVTPLSDGLILHQHIKGSKLKVIDEAGHSPQFTHPMKVAKEINEYL